MSDFRMPNINFDSIVCGGGLDQITPTLSLKNGVARQAANFECGVTGGYVRIAGYERYDGHTSPSDASVATQMVSVVTLVNTPSLAATVTATGGKSATVAYVDGKVIGLCRITGTFALADVLMVGATTIGTIDNLTAGPSTPVQEAKMRNAVADVYRASISAVPGAGAIRGVVEFKDVVYAFRDDATSTICEIYKSSASGWAKVVLLNSVTFSAGTTLPAEGGTLTQGSVTAVVRRVVRSSGAWTGSAAGRFIIDTPAGGTGNFTAGAATIGATTVTLAGAQTAISLLPGGKYEFAIANFTGATATERIYGVDGVNKAFEFDGTYFVPIVTGATTDTPSHIVSHRNYLFLGLKSSIMYSAPGLPYDWTAIGGAGEIACGDDVTGMIAMPGGTTTPTLGIFSRENTYVLYGTGPTTFNFVAYNTGSGAVPFTVQNMAQTLAFDDRGAVSIQAAIQYGNFSQASITANVLPFINERLNKCTCATLNRRKSQYRIFFSDKYGLYITIVNGTPIGCMPVYFNHVVSCVYEGKLSTGEDINFFGSDNGMVYQLDKGTSFDGDPIEWQLVLNYSSAKSPRVLKRFRKAAVELAVQGSSYVDMFLGYALGYDSIEYEQMYSDTASLFLSNSDAYYTYLSTSRWDNFIWDNFFWDTRGLSPLEVSLSGTAENIALAFSGMLDYVQPFTINSIMIHYTPRRVMR